MRWEKATGAAFTAEESSLLAEALPRVDRAVRGGYRLALKRADGTWFLAVSDKGRELRSLEFNAKEKMK